VSRRDWVIAEVDYYLAKIELEFPGFEDDGLSGGFPDWVYAGYRLSDAGRVHDWHYCSRAHKRGTMNQEHRLFADLALRQHARELLPWYLGFAAFVLYFGVRWGGGKAAWNSCGPSVGTLCRHNLAAPRWMAALR